MKNLTRGFSRQISRALFRLGPSAGELAEALFAPARDVKMEILRRTLDECDRVASSTGPDDRFVPVQRALATETDAHVLSFLVRVVSHLGGSNTLRVLTPLLRHRDARVVANTLEAMALTGDETVFTLALPLIGREEPRIRATALAVLCRYDRAAAIDSMVHFLRTSSRPEDRRGALFALKSVGEVPSVVLETLMEEVDDPEVRTGLGRILEEKAPTGPGRIALVLKNRFARLTGGRLDRLPPIRPAGWIGAVAILAAIVWLAWPRPSGDPALSRLLPFVGPPPIQAVARAAPSRFAGTRVTWRGTVFERRAEAVLVDLQGSMVRVEPVPGQAEGGEGDRVEVAGTVRGRSATGLVYLGGATIRLIEKRASGGPPPDGSYRQALSLAGPTSEGGDPKRARLLVEMERAWPGRQKEGRR